MPTAAQNDEVAYTSGVNADGTLTAKAFTNWNGATPAGYGAGGYTDARKWGSSQAGTSATVRYYLDPRASWSAAETQAFTAAFALWSAITNISFVASTDSDATDITIWRSNDKAANTIVSATDQTSDGTGGKTGTKNLLAITGATIDIDTSAPGFGPLDGTFTTGGGYPLMTILHEIGHAIGLGHAGPYNESASSGSQQNSAYDNRLWSVMSYINPTDSGAAYYGQDGVSGTNWAGHASTTWMPLDILAAQRLYGLPASTPLSGGQSFGFNCNVTGDIEPYFDFTKNTSPVITIWDEGAGNTLDLSGFASASTVNLAPGSFSSAAGLTNNIAIAYNTAIDTLRLGSGNNSVTCNNDGDTIYAGSGSDTIIGGSGDDTVVFSGNRASYTITLNASSTTIKGSGTDTLINVEQVRFDDQTVDLASLGPALTSTSPVDNATKVGMGANLSMTFNRAIKCGSGVISIHKSDGSLVTDIRVTDSRQISISGNSLIIDPTADLAPNTSFYVTMDAGAVQDLAGNSAAAIGSATAFTFTTGAPPTLVQTSPSDDATGVAANANLSLTFNEAIQAGSGVVGIHKMDGSLVRDIAVTDASQATISGNTLILKPTADLPLGTTFYVTMDTGAVRDLAGNRAAGIGSTTAFNFTTVPDLPPALVSISPADDSTGVAANANLSLTFSEAIQAGSGVIGIHKTDGSLVRDIYVTDASQATISGNTLTINPTLDLPSGTSFYVTMDTGAVRDLAGNPAPGIGSTTAFNFTTAPDLPPALVSTSPADDTTGVAPAANLSLTFSEAIQAGSGVIGIHKMDGSLVRDIHVTDASQVSISGNTLTLNPAADLPLGTTFYVTMDTGAVRDLAGNPAAGIGSTTAFNFTTVSPPTLVGTTPADDAWGVAADANLSLTFNEAIQAGSGVIGIHKMDGSLVTDIYVTDARQASIAGNTLTLNPSADLPLGTTFYVTMDTGAVRDLAGNPAAGIGSTTAFNFTTVPDSPPALVSTSPADDATGVAPAANLSLTFSEAIQAGSGVIGIHKMDGSLVRDIYVTDASQASISGSTLTLNPTVDLPSGTSFYVTMDTGAVRDLAGNPAMGIGSTTAFNFTTGSSPAAMIGIPS